MTELPIEYREKIRKILLENFSETSEFLQKLLKEDDWSFVIKSHAFIEAVLSDYITAKLGNSRLLKIFKKLNMSGSEISKISFAKELRLLNSEQISFIRLYSELRNDLVHNIENINFSLENFISKMNKQKKNSWLNRVIWFTKEKKNKEKWIKITTQTPKVGLWMSIFMFAPLLKIRTSQEKEISRLKSSSKSKTYFDVEDL